MQRDLAPLCSTINRQQQVANLDDLQRCALNARLVDQRRGVKQTVEIEVAAGPQISSQLLGQLLLALDPLPVTRGRELHHAGLSRRGTGIHREHPPQLVEFEHALAAVLDWAGDAHRLMLDMVQEMAVRSVTTPLLERS